MFEDFEEWFAVRDRHDDEKICPAKLTFSQENGITLKSIQFAEFGEIYSAPNCDGETLTGYLDYQCPTTLIKPWVQSRGGGNLGINTPIMRSKSRIFASAILKNIHLEDLNEKCFTALYMDMPAFSAWYAPELVKSGYQDIKVNKPSKLQINVDEPIREEFSLKDKTTALVSSFAEARDEENTTIITQRTLLTFEFPEALDYSAIQKRLMRVNTIFSFFLGHQMAQNPSKLKTTHTKKWNDRNENLVAEFIFQTDQNRKTRFVRWHDALFLRQDCALTLENTLNLTIELPDDIFYLMNIILHIENSKKLSAGDFSQLLGCIENYDINENGSMPSSRAEPNHRSARITLAERLNCLQRDWADSGFREHLEIQEIVSIRNDISHGRGINLSSEIYQKMVWFNYDLCAIARFHIFRTLGIQAEEIGAAFRRMHNKYGKYAPARTSQ